MSKKIELDGEAADRITVLNLKECRNYLKKELRQYKKGEYLHPEDVAGNIKMIEALNLVIKYFGEE
jgi:hypothetical protein